MSDQHTTAPEQAPDPAVGDAGESGATFVGFTGDAVEQAMVTIYGDRAHLAFRAHVGESWSAPLVLLREPS